MATLNYTIDINAPKEKVWQTLLDDATYREWTRPFHEGSYFEGSWEKGAEMRFLAEDDGKLSGMYSCIAENIPYEFISIEHLGEIIDNQKVTPSEDAAPWVNAHESYRLSEKNGVTTVAIDIQAGDVGQEMTDMFNEAWPIALQKLKEIAERQ